ncbi:MAG: ester cyclase [Paracoccaceae bacterium]
MRPLMLSLATTMMLLVSAPAIADDRAVVEALYTDLLSNPKGDDLDARVGAVVAEDWVSTPKPRGGPDAAGMTKTLAGFGIAIADLNWQIQEILQDDNRYVVRSIATGAPVKPVFGVEPKGNSFEIMTIDIHMVENGRLTRSYHVEEWLTAVQQLQAE